MTLVLTTFGRNARRLLLVLSTFVLTACSGIPQVISAYDESTDKALTALQQSSDDFVTKLIDAAPSEGNGFDKQKTFYEDADKQLRRLEFRVTAIPRNAKTVKLVADIRTVILGSGKCSTDGTSLRDLHCLPSNASMGPSKATLQIAQRNINQVIGAALALELAKKQGSEENKQ